MNSILLLTLVISLTSLSGLAVTAFLYFTLTTKAFRKIKMGSSLAFFFAGGWLLLGDSSNATLNTFLLITMVIAGGLYALASLLTGSEKKKTMQVRSLYSATYK